MQDNRGKRRKLNEDNDYVLVQELEAQNVNVPNVNVLDQDDVDTYDADRSDSEVEEEKKDDAEAGNIVKLNGNRFNRNELFLRWRYSYAPLDPYTREPVRDLRAVFGDDLGDPRFKIGNVTDHGAVLHQRIIPVNDATDSEVHRYDVFRRNDLLPMAGDSGSENTDYVPSSYSESSGDESELDSPLVSHSDQSDHASCTPSNSPKKRP